MEVNHTDNPCTYLEVERSKVEVTRPINIHTVNAQYLPKGKAYELQTWHADRAWRPASPISAVNSKVKGQGRKVTWCVWYVLTHKSRTKVQETSKLVLRLPTPLAIMCSSSKIKGQRSRSPDPLMLRPVVRHIFRMGGPTKFKLEMEYKDPYCWEAPLPPMS